MSMDGSDRMVCSAASPKSIKKGAFGKLTSSSQKQPLLTLVSLNKLNCNFIERKQDEAPRIRCFRGSSFFAVGRESQFRALEQSSEIKHQQLQRCTSTRVYRLSLLRLSQFKLFLAYFSIPRLQVSGMIPSQQPFEQ